MNAFGSFLLFVGKNFGAGALSVAGNIAAAAIVPVVIPKIAGAIKGFREAHAPAADDADPDLC